MIYPVDSAIQRLNNRGQVLIVQTLDSANPPGPVVQKADSTIQRINLYPLDNAIGFPNTYPLESNLSSG